MPALAIGRHASVHYQDLEFEELPYRRKNTGLVQWIPIGMPKLPPRILSSSFFLYPNSDDARAGKKFGGTGFFVGIPSQADPERMTCIYGVTNWHVACREGCSVVRVNRKDGDPAIFDYGPEDWVFIPGDDDIAVIELPLNINEHRFAYVSTDQFLTQAEVSQKKAGRVGVGDDVFMIGRFIDHDGVQRNNPSARFGNISMLPDGNIKRPNGSFLPSFCVDMHSRTGYSGSPVFVYRTLGNNFAVGDIDLGDRFLLLLGIHWGQFPEYWEIKDRKDVPNTFRREALVTEGNYVEGLSGMTCVAPAWKLMELLEIDKLKKRRAIIEQKFLEKLKDEPPAPKAESASPENPQHKEDFNRLLGAAVQKPKQDDQT